MRKLIIFMLILFLLVGNICAQEDIGIDTDPVEEGVPEDALQVLPTVSVNQTPDFWSTVKQVLLNALGESETSLHSALRMCTILLCIMVLCAFANLSAGSRTGDAATVVGALGMCVAFVSTANAMADLADKTIRSMAEYSTLMLPVLATACAMSGGITTSGALYAGTMLLSRLFLGLISKLLIPAVYCYFAIATAEAALGNDLLSEIRSLVGWVVSKSLRILTYIFLGYLTVTGVIGGTADATAIRATKATLSGMVPVVGGIISDASDTLLASAAAIKSSVGILGMVVILSICIVPFLRLGIQYLLLKLTVAISGAVGLKPHTKLMKSFSDGMGFLLAMCGSCCFLLLISCVCFLKVVV